MTCPLCNHERASSSWLGSTIYRGKEFIYLQCHLCESLFCNPMPDGDDLSEMYGPEYESSFEGLENQQEPKEPEQVVQWLEKSPRGTFVDYGCGDGSLLSRAMGCGWRAIGVELDRDVARLAEERSGARVFQGIGGSPMADVLHLGDVIEHLTNLNQQLPEILKRIKPGGILLAQGPLEANASLFLLALRLARSLKRNRRSTMAPYHVILATAKGQRVMFQRFGLEEIEYDVREALWPAPAMLTWQDLASARTVGLFGLRRFSQCVSYLAPGQLGNRYFYVGRRGPNPETISP